MRTGTPCYYIIAIALALLLSSCTAVPSSSLVQFSNAVSLTAENNMSAYAEIERVHHDVEVMKVVVEFDGKGFKPDEMTPFFDENALKVRKQVLDAICLYAGSLATISGTGQLDGFDAETKNLGRSLENLGEGIVKSSFFRNVPVKDSQIQVFTAAVNAIGRWIIEYKKDSAIREGVVGMDGNFREICRLFEEDFGNPPDGSRRNPGGLRAQQWNQYDELMMLQDRFIGDNRNKLDPAAKKQEIEKLASLPGRQKQADSALAEIQDSFRKLRGLHNSLAVDAADGKQDSTAMIRKLIAEGKRISKFYKSLGKGD